METYYGVVRSPADAIKLFEACRLGLLPRVQRRLSEKERQAIRSGSVFVWDEREAGMRRWTDGKSWSASRVAGSFLTYREMEGKRGNAFGGGRRAAGKTPDSGRGSDEDHDDGEPDGYRYKPDGLTKQSFSITNAAGQHLHLIAYYSRGPLDLPLPSSDPSLRHIVPAKGMYPESSLAETTPPAPARAPLPQPSYMPHHHQPPPHHGYAPQYPHPGYAWPPSPVGTPPYGHGHYPYSQGPPPAASHAYPPHPHAHPSYAPAEPTSAHERTPLPPLHAHSYAHQHPHAQHPPHAQPHPEPQHQHHPPHPQQNQHQHQQNHPQLPALVPPRIGMPPAQPYPQNQNHSPQAPPPRLSLLESPRSQHLQAKAREAVQIEPRLAPIDAARNQHSPLPAPGQLAHQQQQQQQPQPNGTTTGIPTSATATTPSSSSSSIPYATSVAAASPTIIRAPSDSPPRSAISDNSGGVSGTPTAASTRPTLSALLHPSSMPAGSEPNSANPASAVSAVSAVSGVSGVSASSNGGGGGGGVSSAGSSPSGGAAGMPASGSSSAGRDLRSQGEDARAIGVLNKNFF